MWTKLHIVPETTLSYFSITFAAVRIPLKIADKHLWVLRNMLQKYPHYTKQESFGSQVGHLSLQNSRMWMINKPTHRSLTPVTWLAGPQTLTHTAYKDTHWCSVTAHWKLCADTGHYSRVAMNVSSVIVNKLNWENYSVVFQWGRREVGWNSRHWCHVLHFETIFNAGFIDHRSMVMRVLI